eukprot:CFRG5586T1
MNGEDEDLFNIGLSGHDDFDYADDGHDVHDNLEFRTAGANGIHTNDDIPLMEKNESGQFRKQGDAHGGGRIRSTGVGATFMNLLKSFVGSGILGLPAAFREGGFLTTLLLLLMVGSIATTCNLMLVKTKQHLVSRGVVSFSDIGVYLFGKKFGHLVDLLLIFTQFGFCCVYMVFVSENLTEFLPWSREVILLGIAPFFVLTSFIRTMSFIAPFSMAANITLVSGLFAIVACAISQMETRALPGQTYDIDKWVVWKHVPVTFGIAVYAFEGIGVILPCETSMKEPRKFPALVVWVMTIATTGYIIFGGSCYLAFGEHTSDEILSNMEMFGEAAGGAWPTIEKITRVFVIFAIAATFPLQLFVIVDIVEEEILFKPGGGIGERCKSLKQNIFRTMLVMAAVTVAYFVPDFGPLLGLVGAFGSASLQFILPALFHLKLFPEASKLRKFFCVVFIVIGSVGGILGTIDSVKQLIHQG